MSNQTTENADRQERTAEPLAQDDLEAVRRLGEGFNNIKKQLARVIVGQDRTIHDTIASLIYGKLFERIPTLRLGTIELGCAGVPSVRGR